MKAASEVPHYFYLPVQRCSHKRLVHLRSTSASHTQLYPALEEDSRQQFLFGTLSARYSKQSQSQGSRAPTQNHVGRLTEILHHKLWLTPPLCVPGKKEECGPEEGPILPPPGITWPPQGVKGYPPTLWDVNVMYIFDCFPRIQVPLATTQDPQFLSYAVQVG